MRIASAALIATALALPAGAETRSLSGTVAYRERIALDPSALLVVEARDAAGALVGEARVPSDGRQVPLPFALDVPAGDLTLRAALFVGGAALFATPPVAVADGADGPAMLATRGDALAAAQAFRCGGTAVSVAVDDGAATLFAGGAAVALTAEPAASGARYAAPDGTLFWSKGNAATVSLEGTDLPECEPVIAPALLPLTARGNEPFWRLDIGPDAATLTEPGGSATLTTGPGTMTAAGLRLPLDPGLTATIAPLVHRDTMTGMPYPYTVTLTRDGAALTGGGGDPLALLEGPEWRASAVAGETLAPDVEVTFAVLPGGRIAGKSACNRYMGQMSLTGEGLSFGPLAGTMMACPDPLMAAERLWLDTLATVTRFDIAADGALILYAGDTEAARLAR